MEATKFESGDSDIEEFESDRNASVDLSFVYSHVGEINLEWLVDYQENAYASICQLIENRYRNSEANIRI